MMMNMVGSQVLSVESMSCEVLCATCFLREARDEWMKEVHEKLKLSMLKLIGECEVKSSCSLLKSKGDRRMMLKLSSVTVHLFPDGDMKMV